MRLVLGHDQAVGAWVAARIPMLGVAEAFGPFAAIGVASTAGELIGGVVFHGYRPSCRTIQLSFASASPRWLTKSLIVGIMAYPFDQLQCERVTAYTPKRARDARRFIENFGFKREGLMRKEFGDDDAVISGLLKREWQQSRWVRPRKVRDGQINSSSAGSA